MMSLAIALDAIKKKEDDLYAVVIDEQEFVFRLPSLKKIEQYMSLLSVSANDESFQVIIYEHIFKNFVEGDSVKEDADLQAGISQSIARLILYLSGQGEGSLDYTNKLLNNCKENQDILLSIKATICSVFPGYTFETLEMLNYQKIISIFVQAEKILLQRGIIESETVLISKEEKQQQNKKRIQEQIRQDQAAFDSFNKPKGPDPRMQQIRKDALRRAEQEELKYRKMRGG